MCTCNEVLYYLYYNEFMKNYYIWKFYGEDDNFIQIDNHNLPYTLRFGKLRKIF